jgi:hypothetical protein
MADENDTDMADEGERLLSFGGTCDCKPPKMPGVGQWQELEDPVNNLTYLELEEYCTFRRMFMRYIEFLSDKVLVQDMIEALETLDQNIRKFPSKHQLLGQAMIPDITGSMRICVSFHTSYLEFDDIHTYTRSAMLAQLPGVVQKLKDYHAQFRQTLTGGRLEGCDTLYSWVLRSFEKWKGMAESSFKVPYSALLQREQSGSFRKSAAKLEELFLELKMFTK